MLSPLDIARVVCAAAKTRAPLMNCMRSLANHAAFGAGLFIAAALLDWMSR